MSHCTDMGQSRARIRPLADNVKSVGSKVGYHLLEWFRNLG